MTSQDKRRQDEDAPSRTYDYDPPSNWKDRPVIVTWTCALVCRQWRQLLLHSPSLWGRLIDLDAFSVMDPLWKDDIMHRTADSPLFVKGSAFVRWPREKEFFLSIIRDYWPRVEGFRMRISGGMLLESNTWDFLFRPAPSLRQMHLHSRDGFDSSLFHSDMHLFNDHAPLLESFASWRLGVFFHPKRNEWLRALQRMPCLESLCLLKALPNPPDTSTSTPIQLPRLCKVDLNGGLRACTVFLAQIIPPTDCHLFIDTFDEDEPLTSADLSLATKVLTRYSRKFLDSLVRTSLAFALYDLGFRIADKAPRRDVQKELTFYVDISSPASTGLFSLLQGPSSCNFKTIKTLELQTDASSFGGGWDKDVVDFLRTLEGVELILADMSALRTLGDEDNDYSNIFPNLREIKVTKSMGYEDVFSYSHELLPFLESRRSLGAPIEVLDFSLWTGLEDVGRFNGIEGLKVIYCDEEGVTIREHYCRPNATAPPDSQDDRTEELSVELPRKDNARTRSLAPGSLGRKKST
ncbi:hypothetical protein CPB84DRAFT_1743295 [Gymnopilus junonius]|uniref:F-box domain-containing protein n=1 Tax=Gymnopilus junonius TaxID=109634 RepID=A0A9P5P0P6_GYMJU|nr:hypothetical protein CPB84DRAFT_1743295 [Gymnopilus junonius]